MKKALILHCWLNKSDAHWYSWLKIELEKKGYEVYLPDLPTMNTNLPDLTKMVRFIEKNYSLDRDTVVIGHSLGAVLGMRLAEKYKFNKLITVSGWDYDDLTYEHRLFWKTKFNHKKIIENVKEIYCIGSDNDPYYTSIVFEDVSKRLNGKLILIKGAGHFTEKYGITKIPQLLKYI